MNTGRMCHSCHGKVPLLLRDIRLRGGLKLITSCKYVSGDMIIYWQELKALSSCFAQTLLHYSILLGLPCKINLGGISQDWAGYLRNTDLIYYGVNSVLYKLRYYSIHSIN